MLTRDITPKKDENNRSVHKAKIRIGKATANIGVSRKSKVGIVKNALGIVLLLLSIVVFVFGYVYQYGSKFNLSNLIKDYYSNVSSSLASIAITILIIDYLNGKRADYDMMQSLAREMGSKDNAFAMKAVREMRAHKWLMDGSLHTVNLDAADLRTADLNHADLSYGSLVAVTLTDADMSKARLVGAKITGAKLQEADFRDADMSHADLRWSDLGNANLTGACLEAVDLSGASLVGTQVSVEQLRGAKSLSKTVMPDGRSYEEWVDLQLI